MRFDYGRLNETVTAIEVGLSAEYYTNKISQMLFNKEKQFFFNAYVALLLGRRKMNLKLCGMQELPVISKIEASSIKNKKARLAEG